MTNLDALRILFITGEYPPMQGGVADYTRELGRAEAHGRALISVEEGKSGFREVDSLPHSFKLSATMLK